MLMLRFWADQHDLNIGSYHIYTVLNYHISPNY